jgi:hypothetical protein
LVPVSSRRVGRVSPGVWIGKGEAHMGVPGKVRPGRPDMIPTKS